MKIIVTGGAGFIGGNFVHYMVNQYPEDMIIEQQLYLMHADSTELRDTIRYQQMRYTEIFHLTDLIYSSQKRHRFIHQAHIHHQRQVRTFLYLHTIEHMVFL